MLHDLHIDFYKVVNDVDTEYCHNGKYAREWPLDGSISQPLAILAKSALLGPLCTLFMLLNVTCYLEFIDHTTNCFSLIFLQ
jgi:hypothetical protein